MFTGISGLAGTFKHVSVQFLADSTVGTRLRSADTQTHQHIRRIALELDIREPLQSSNGTSAGNVQWQRLLGYFYVGHAANKAALNVLVADNRWMGSNFSAHKDII